MSDNFERLMDDWLNDGLAEEDASRLMAIVKERPDLMRQFVEANVRDQLLRSVVRVDSIAEQILALPDLPDFDSSPSRLHQAISTRRLTLTIATATSFAAALWFVIVMIIPNQHTPLPNRSDRSDSIAVRPDQVAPKPTIPGSSADRQFAASEDMPVEVIDSGDKHAMVDVKKESRMPQENGPGNTSNDLVTRLTSHDVRDLGQPERKPRHDGIISFECSTIDRIAFGNEHRISQYTIEDGGSEFFVNFNSPSLQ